MKDHDWYFAGGPSGMKPCSSQEVLERLQVSLTMRGHSPTTIQRYLAAWQHFRRWLEVQGKDLLAVTEQDVRVFLSGHPLFCRCPKPAPKKDPNARAALNHLLAVVREPNDPPMSDGTVTPIQQELIDFTDYLKHLCGLSESTCTYRIRYAGEFLAKMFPEGPIAARDLRPKAVMKWVAQRAEQCKPGTASAIAGSVRRYLQFCQFRGLIAEHLVHAIPRFPRWRLSEVPRYLGEEDLQRFLRCFNLHTEVGCRDFAMALCMVEMGLRASEVAGIKMQDIDWRQSILHIRETKCRRMRMLPLPNRPGRAIARYLRRGRPRTTEPRLFVRHSVPLGSVLTAELVRGAMRRAYARAGFPPEWTGTHLLRHTAASRMHQRGATLKEVADVLGHGCIDTTAIYTKVNLPALRTVALPWPEVQP